MEEDSELTESFKGEVKKAIEIYEENGIVTRKDVATMDSRPGARKIFSILNEQYPEAYMEEIALPDYSDYSNIIYNTNEYDTDEAKEYMLKYVIG